MIYECNLHIFRETTIRKAPRDTIEKALAFLDGDASEILGSLSVFGWKIPGTGDGMLAFVMAPGAFLCLGYLMVLFNKFLAKK